MVTFVKRKLGDDILSVELTNKQVWMSFEEATLEYGKIVNEYQAKSQLGNLLGMDLGTKNDDQNYNETNNNTIDGGPRGAEGRFPRETWGAYSISKSGLEAFTEILSQELFKENIIVNSINPGGTATLMRKEAYPEEDQSELPTADDILPIFLYLASDEAEETGMKYNAREYIGSL